MVLGNGVLHYNIQNVKLFLKKMYLHVHVKHMLTCMRQMWYANVVYDSTRCWKSIVHIHLQNLYSFRSDNLFHDYMTPSLLQTKRDAIY